MQGYESLVLVLVFFLVVGFGGWFVGILWRKCHPFPPGIKHIPIKEITQQGCLGEDGRLISWNDVQAVIKESQSFPNYSAEGSFSIAGHLKTVYRITASHILPNTYYELRHFPKSMFTSDERVLAQTRKKFNAKALLLLDNAKAFPHIEFKSYGYWGRERKTIDQEREFLSKWPNASARRMIRAGRNAKYYYGSLVFFALLIILGSLLWFKR